MSPSSQVPGGEARGFLKVTPRVNERVWKIPFPWMREGERRHRNDTILFILPCTRSLKAENWVFRNGVSSTGKGEGKELQKP